MHGVAAIRGHRRPRCASQDAGRHTTLLPRHALFDLHQERQADQRNGQADQRNAAVRKMDGTSQWSLVGSRIDSYQSCEHIGDAGCFGGLSIAAVGSTGLRGAYCAAMMLAPFTEILKPRRVRRRRDYLERRAERIGLRRCHRQFKSSDLAHVIDSSAPWRAMAPRPVAGGFPCRRADARGGDGRGCAQAPVVVIDAPRSVDVDGAAGRRLGPRWRAVAARSTRPVLRGGSR